LLVAVAGQCLAGETPASASDPEAAAEAAGQKPGLGHRLLFYLPNRVLDLADVLRLRGRLGPGLAAGFRGTEYVSFYAGTYNTVYAGLPGARRPAKWRSPVGRERWKGIVFFGVDATDTASHGPGYTPAEFALGAQLLIVGADVGFEPVELGDLLSGLFLMDPVGDDL
jgi:hypothetical protein